MPVALRPALQRDFGYCRRVYFAQMFVDRPFQGRGIGTEIMKRLIDEAAAASRQCGSTS